jgi:hypothetical protein
VLCKGGHHLNDANDLLGATADTKWFNGKRIDNPNTHGTGCTLSSAIAANLAKGYDLDFRGAWPRRTSPALWPPCWTWARAAAPWTTPSTEGGVQAGGGRMKKTSTFQNGLIWFGAGVSIAEILTGTYFAPLGMAKGWPPYSSGISSAAPVVAGRAHRRAHRAQRHGDRPK